MAEKDKEQMLGLLAETHLVLQATLDEVDLEMVVYNDSGWRVRDIIGHIATWDMETARSINAYREGSEYSILDLDDTEVDYNERAVVAQQKLSNQQVLNEWEQAYDKLKRSVQDMPIDLLPGDMLFPWGNEHGSISKLIEYMVEHAIEHRGEILKTKQV
jgi:uncharacterized damage-inducible protein DinB